MHDYAFQPGNSTQLFQANDGGVWLTSSSGVDWVQKSDGLGATENYHAAASPFYAGLISTGTQDNGELVFTGNAWKTNRGGDWTTKMQMDYSTQKFVYYFNDKERRPLPSGGGTTYNVPAAITSAAIKHVFSPDDQNLAYVSGTSIWQTKNASNASPIWTQIVSATSTIRAMAVCKNHSNIFAYTAGNRFYISHDALSAVPSFTMTTLASAMTTGDIVISSIDTNLIYVIITNKVYKSNDGGLTFVDYTGILPNVNHMKLFLDDYSGNNSLYLGNNLGVYYRNNSMSDWVNYSGVLPSISNISDIMYFNDGGVDARLYVSYYGRGTWETKLENSNTCPTPINIAAALIGTNVSVTWNTTGVSQYEIQYREEGTFNWTSMNVSTNSATISSYNGCTNYELRVRSKCTSSESLWSERAYFNTPSNLLNNDFDNHQDIGGVGAAGSVCYDAVNQRYTIFASGEDIWDKNDEFHFLYKKIQGDISISARVRHIGNIYGWAKGGVMIRENLATDSKHSMCALTPGNGFANQWRTNTNDWSDNKDTAGTEPGWVKLERLGSNFIASFSTDGIIWNVFNTATITMSDTVYVGLANCSHIDSTLNDAVFDHIVINGIALSTSTIEDKNLPFVVYPNPAKNELNIKLSEIMKDEIIDISVIDMTGKIIMTKSKMNSSVNEIINIAELSSGVYFLEVKGKTRAITQFIKQ